MITETCREILIRAKNNLLTLRHGLITRDEYHVMQNEIRREVGLGPLRFGNDIMSDSMLTIDGGFV